MTATPVEKMISPREMLLVAMLARGHTTDRAARELRLSRHTVGEEISTLLGRFNCRNRAELVAYCYVHRLLPIGIWPPPYDATEPSGVRPGPDLYLVGE
jgi:DNA-binding NarL/FixJ family response regulator